MKKLFSTLLLLCVLMGVNAQKNPNGVIYDKHPAIDLVEKFMQAFVQQVF